MPCSVRYLSGVLPLAFAVACLPHEGALVEPAGEPDLRDEAEPPTAVEEVEFIEVQVSFGGAEPVLVRAEVVDGHGVVDDLIIGSVETLRQAAEARDALELGNQWNRDELFYCFSTVPAEAFSAATEQFIEDRLQELAQGLPFVLTEVATGCLGTDFILRSDPNPNNSSRVGVTGACAHPIDFWLVGSDQTDPETIAHEFWHILGAHHEQTRDDRDQHVTVYFDHMVAGGASAYWVGSGPGQTLVPGGWGFDYASIMLYGLTSRSQNGEPTMLRRNSIGMMPMIFDASGVDIGTWGHFATHDPVDPGIFDDDRYDDRLDEFQDYRVGDFNRVAGGPTPLDDLWRLDAVSAEWQVLPSDDPDNGWKTTRTGATLPLEDLRFGDLNCDGETDVFTVQGDRFQIVPSATGSWVDWAVGVPAQAQDLAKLRLADVTNDGCDDVLWDYPALTAEWRYMAGSPGGGGGWDRIVGATFDFASQFLAFQDMTNDGIADIVSEFGDWRMREIRPLSGTTLQIDAPRTLGPDPVPLSEVAFGDWDADGFTDILYVDELSCSGGGKDRWRFAPGGDASAASTVRCSRSLPRAGKFLVGDFFAASDSPGPDIVHPGWFPASGDDPTDIDFGGVQRLFSDLWRASVGGTSRWQTAGFFSADPADAHVLHLDTDGVLDVLVADGGPWQWAAGDDTAGLGFTRRELPPLSDILFRFGDLAELSTNDAPADEMLVGNFLGDCNAGGCDEVLTVEGGRYIVRSCGDGPPRDMGAAQMPLGDLAAVDIDRDGCTDLFRAAWPGFPEWYVLKVDGGITPWDQAPNGWQQVCTSCPETIDQVAFGEFSGYGSVDVFSDFLVGHPTESNWRYFDLDAGSYTTLVPSTVGLDQVAVGDFGVGDPVLSDVFFGDGAQWWALDGGGTWVEVINQSEFVRSQLRFVDINGDGITDPLASFPEL